MCLFLSLLLIKHSDKSDLKEKGLILALCSREHSPSWEKPSSRSMRPLVTLYQEAERGSWWQQSRKGKSFSLGEKTTGRLLMSQWHGLFIKGWHVEPLRLQWRNDSVSWLWCLSQSLSVLFFWDSIFHWTWCSPPRQEYLTVRLRDPLVSASPVLLI